MIAAVPAPTIGVLHPGQMGAAVAGQLKRAGATVLWDPTGRSQDTAERAIQAGLEPVDARELFDRADAVLSICPPAAAETVAELIASHRYSGLVVEANAISPQRYQRIAATLTAAGARVLDGGIIGPPPIGAATCRLYLAGDANGVVFLSDAFAETGVTVIGIGDEPGTASGLKMAYASYQKATRALAAVAHALAAEHGVTDQLISEAERMTVSALAEPDYFPSVAARAWRWAPEMLEVADTLRDAQLPADLALAAEKVLAHWNGQKDQWGVSPADVLHQLKEAPQEDVL